MQRKLNPKAAQTIKTIKENIQDVKEYSFVQVTETEKEFKDKHTKNIFNDIGNKTIFVKQGVYAMSTRKLQGLIEISKIQHYYICNPVKFVDDWFNIELLDAQAFIFQRAWACPNVLLVCSRGFGKSTMIDLLIMTKGMLLTNYWSYIASGSGSQAEQTFTTLEKLANDAIESMVGSTGSVFKDEVIVKNASGDGFSHGSDGFTYELFGGAFTKTLNSNIDRRRGARGNLVVFDECGFLSAEMLSVYGAFVIVNKSFSTGKDRDGNSLDMNRLRSIPSQIPNQLFYISSASSTDTEFYKMYRDFSKRMIIGDLNYFVASIDCEIVLHPTLRGKEVSPLYDSTVIEAAQRQNPEKADREYRCIFTTDAGVQSIIKRGTITRNEETRKPTLFNDTGDKKFVITYDPARSRDNSVILVMEIYKQNGEYKGKIVNCINLIDIGKKRRMPMQTPDQVEYLKEVILDYNQGGDETYSNILGIYIDAGSGGGGVNIADYLMEDWKGKDGKIHRGLIDKEYSAEYVKKFPNAINKIKLMSPTQYKSMMYEALIELTEQNKISFTASYDNKGYITVFDIDQVKLEKAKKEITARLKKQNLTDEDFEIRFKEELDKVQNVQARIEMLDWQEELALAGIDALKEELVNMIRIKRDNGKDSFEITASKRRKLHDDRAYCCCLAAYALQQERRKNITQKKKTSSETKTLVSSLPIRVSSRYKKTS